MTFCFALEMERRALEVCVSVLRVEVRAAQEIEVFTTVFSLYSSRVALSLFSISVFLRHMTVLGM